MLGAFRVIYRFPGFCLIALSCCLDFCFRIWLTGRAGKQTVRAQWSHFWGTQFRRLLGIRLQVHGRPPTQGMLASNHLSYLDIVVYAACQPFIFVSKSEVRWWPIIGQMSRCAGTLFIDRDQRGDVKRMADAFESVIQSGCVVALFPEGTSTGGDRVLPFHSSLFEPAASKGWSVTPAWIGYHVPGGDASEEVAYWKDMTFFPHLLHLFSLREIQATVRFGATLPAGLNRKEMAKRLHQDVVALSAASSESSSSKRAEVCVS